MRILEMRKLVPPNVGRVIAAKKLQDGAMFLTPAVKVYVINGTATVSPR